nr:hypothetical protein [Tanacetum cinerariifolium]
MFPVELTNEDISNSEGYKEYYAIASGVAPPKTKASVRKTKSSSNTTITPPTVAGTRLLTSEKGKQPAKSSKAKGLTVLFEVAMTEAEQINLAMKRSLQQTQISQASGFSADEGTDDEDEVDERSDDQEDDDDDQDDDVQDDNNDDQDTDNNGDDFVHPKLSIYEEEAKDEERFDPIVQTPENSNDEGNDDASLGLNVGGEDGQDAEDDDEELYRDPESTSAPKEKATKTSGKSTQGSKSHQKIASESAPAEEPMQTTQDLEEPSHQEFETGVANDQAITENRLMRIDELHKLSDGTLNDVRTALDDRLKGIRMKYLPQDIWRKSDNERAAAMIQAIDKQLKTKRIMQSLEKFVGGRLYKEDFRMLQRTI